MKFHTAAGRPSKPRKFLSGSRSAPNFTEIIELEIVAESSFVDIVGSGFDAGVRYGEHLAQDMIAVSLCGPQRYAVVAAPAYLDRYGRPKHPKDLLHHPAIRTRFGSGAILDWEFEKAGRVVKVSPPAKLIGTYLGLAMQSGP
jgi:DNA-binding transcriptional LysR family regulator